MNAWLTVNPGWMAAPVRMGFGFLVFTDHACSDRTELGAQEQVVVIQRPDITLSTSGETVQSSVGVLWISISNGRGRFAPKQQVRVLLTGHAWWTGRHLHESKSPHSEFPPVIYYCGYCWRFTAGSCFALSGVRSSAVPPNPMSWLVPIGKSLAQRIHVVSWEKWRKLNKHQSGGWVVVWSSPSHHETFLNHNQTTKTHLFGFLMHCLSESYCKDVQNIKKIIISTAWV